jgi:hypothetical protein
LSSSSSINPRSAIYIVNSIPPLESRQLSTSLM